jgi:hypothetical protein
MQDFPPEGAGNCPSSYGIALAISRKVLHFQQITKL